jgi:hypothetical protein
VAPPAEIISPTTSTLGVAGLSGPGLSPQPANELTAAAAATVRRRHAMLLLGKRPSLSPEPMVLVAMGSMIIGGHTFGCMSS